MDFRWSYYDSIVLVHLSYSESSKTTVALLIRKQHVHVGIANSVLHGGKLTQANTSPSYVNARL